MTNFYQIEYSKKDGGWVVKNQSSNYNYTRVAKSPSFSNIEEAENWVRETHVGKEGSHNNPWIDHKIGESSGHLMPLQVWKECCDDGGFIDYDGHGDMLDENYEFIESGDEDDFFKHSICPSGYTKKKIKIPSNVKYILWYNR
jgi:hypothetical protein